MDVRQDPADQPEDEKKDDVALSDFMGVMGRLQAVIAAENDLLNRGLPATLLDTIDLKVALSEEFGSKGGDLMGGGDIMSNAELQEKLLTATAELYAMTEENRQLLSNALHATRRRVDRVMDAIRALEEEPDANDDPQRDLPPAGRR